MKGAKEFAPPRLPSPPTHGPSLRRQEPNNWRMNMSLLSHSRKNPSTVTPTTGPQSLREYFAPRQVLRLKEAAACIGMSYSHFFRRVQAGTLGLKIRKNEIDERFVLLDDLILYLFPASGTDSASSSPPSSKKKPGRPRKSTEGGSR